MRTLCVIWQYKQVNQAKCIEFMRQSASLGFPPSQHQLGAFHAKGDMGLEENMEEALKYFKEAAEGGNLISRFNLGCTEDINGDQVAAMCHWRLSASGGHRPSMEALVLCFEDGLLHHGDLAETLQAMYLAIDQMSSKDRDQYIQHLKKTGDYEKDPQIRNCCL